MTYDLPTGKNMIGFETITVDDTAGGKALTAATYSKALSSNIAEKQVATYALISVEDNAVRWTVGTDAVTNTTNGHSASANDVIMLHSLQQLQNFRAIRSTAGTAVLHVSYFL